MVPVKLKHLKTNCSEFKEKEIHIHFERVCDELFKAKKKKNSLLQLFKLQMKKSVKHHIE